MIPKLIHYFWDGGQMPYSYKDSWAKFYPDYEIKDWDIANLPIDKFPKLQFLIDNKKYAPLSDFIRHWVLFTFGGFYLDTDIELISPVNGYSLNGLRNIKSFTCIEGNPIFANSAACGAEAGQPFQKMALEMFFEHDFKDLFNGRITKFFRHGIQGGIAAPPEIVLSPYGLTNIVEDSYKKSTLDNTDLTEIQTYPDGFTTLPKQYFYPFNWNEQYSDSCIKPETIGIHWWKKGW